MNSVKDYIKAGYPEDVAIKLAEKKEVKKSSKKKSEE